jgi:hypothetical protein
MLPEVFESREIELFLGMPLNFLNRLVERGLHGIKPSLRSDVKTGGRRWFSTEDVFGIALVYWLFEAGLRAGSGKKRTSVIQNVLDEIVGKRDATANDAAKRLGEAQMAMLVIIQQLYPDPEDLISRTLEVRLTDEREFGPDDPLSLNRYTVEIWIPVLCLFDRLKAIISSRI